MLHGSLDTAIQRLKALIEVCERNHANLPKHASQQSLLRIVEAKQRHELALRELEGERTRRARELSPLPVAPEMQHPTPTAMPTAKPAISESLPKSTPDASSPSAAAKPVNTKMPNRLPHDYAQREDQLAAMFRSKSRPTELQLKCLTLSHYYEWNLSEIGAHIGKHRKTVDGHIAGAKKKLRTTSK